MREDPAGSNAGPRVEGYLKVVGLKRGAPWCAAFVAWCGVQLLGPTWPVPRTGGCAALGEWAGKNGILLDRPAIGDLFLLEFPRLHRFAHVGLVAEDPDVTGHWGTIEGNSNPAGGREGFGVFRHRRAFGSQDRFIRLGTTI